MEYRQESSKRKVHNRTIENFFIWNIPEIIPKKVHNRYMIKWNMEYSIEYSWNFPKKVAQPVGA